MAENRTDVEEGATRPVPRPQPQGRLRPPVPREAPTRDTAPADAADAPATTGASAAGASAAGSDRDPIDFDALHTRQRAALVEPEVMESRREKLRRLKKAYQGPREARLRVRMVSIPSVIGYASLWAVFLLAAFILTVFLLHMGLLQTGVLASVSEAAATLLGLELPASGLLPYAEQDFVIRTALLVGAAFSVLGVLFAITLALAHNVISWMTGGLRFTFRE